MSSLSASSKPVAGAGALAVKVENLHITYRTTFERKPTLKSALTRLGRGERGVFEV